MIKISDDLNLQSVDLTTDICDLCGEESTPMVMADIADINGDGKRYMRQVYACKNCISGKDDTVVKAIERMMQAKKIETKMSVEWIRGDKQDLIEEFIRIEDLEEEIGIKHPLLRKAHIMKEFALKGEAVFSEEDMIEYFNYYGNSIEMVNMLREILASGKKNAFLKDAYISARTRQLTKKQIKSIARNKFAKELFVEVGQIWEEIPTVLAYVEFVDDHGEMCTMIKGIIKFMMEFEYYTERQRAALEIFMRDYKEGIKYFKETILPEVQKLH